MATALACSLIRSNGVFQPQSVTDVCLITISLLSESGFQSPSVNAAGVEGSSKIGQSSYM